jgi:hypothetical protein
LAVEILPEDGEAYLYLGTALMDYAEHVADGRFRKGQRENIIFFLQNAIVSLQWASHFTPKDARVWNNWGIALSRLEKYKWGPKHFTWNVRYIYQQGLDLLVQASIAGCAVQDDMDALSLNYGLYLANQDLYAEACVILERPASKWLNYQVGGIFRPEQITRTIEDSFRLRNWCLRKIGKTLFT